VRAAHQRLVTFASHCKKVQTVAKPTVVLIGMRPTVVYVDENAERVVESPDDVVKSFEILPRLGGAGGSLELKDDDVPDSHVSACGCRYMKRQVRPAPDAMARHRFLMLFFEYCVGQKGTRRLEVRLKLPLEPPLIREETWMCDSLRYHGRSRRAAD
jgi:hypothetical protein